MSNKVVSKQKSITGPGGYDCKWVEDPPDELLCLICLCVARDPHQHGNGGCGKVFCGSCVTEHLKIQPTCPNCRQTMIVSRYLNGAGIIDAMKVKCNNIETGCQWIGELRMLRTHRATCDYEPVPCKYTRVGCKEKPLRKALKAHEEDSLFHLQMAIEAFVDLSTKVSHYEREIAHLNSRAKKHDYETVFTFKLSDFQEHRTNSDVFHSSSFYTSPTGYKMCARVHANGTGDSHGTSVSVGICLMKGGNDDSLPWPFTGTIMVKLLNQLEDKNHHKTSSTFPADHMASQRVVEEERALIGYGFPRFIPHFNLGYKRSRNCQYLMDDTLFFSVAVQAPGFRPWLVCSTQTD